uniref:Uncharacterized protein n=1 Tax=Aegilops tauschii subsp. strangulata TaxID=200361 RepID=A0A453SY54_AEGTS
RRMRGGTGGYRRSGNGTTATATSGPCWPSASSRRCTSRSPYTNPARERGQDAGGASQRSESGTTTAMATTLPERRPSSTSASSLSRHTNHSSRNSLVTTPRGSGITRWRGKPGWMALGPTQQWNSSPSRRSRLLTTICMR